ncbi:hypothetical protein J3F83DRAFT_648168 [Trichoderma novae-zelandiae]
MLVVLNLSSFSFHCFFGDYLLAVVFVGLVFSRTPSPCSTFGLLPSFLFSPLPFPLWFLPFSSCLLSPSSTLLLI